MNEGDLIPNITLRSVDSDGIQNFNLVENFQNKKVLVICVPGAFTSTCHNCLLYTSPSPRDYAASRMPSSA